MKNIIANSLLALTLGAPLAHADGQETKPTDKMATLNISGPGLFSVFRDQALVGAGSSASLNKSIQVPSGNTLNIVAHMEARGIDTAWSCSAGLSFLPKDGQVYYVHSFIGGDEHCYCELVQAADDTPTGLAPEPSVVGPRYTSTDDTKTH